MKKLATSPNEAPPNEASPAAPPARAWQRMLSGRRLDLLDPSPRDIEIEDIAHGLARVARWNGQTVGLHAFSVAQHSLVVDDIAGARNPDWTAMWRRAALLHDAAEYVVGDLISPFKTAIGLDYKALELRLLSAIHERFALPRELPDGVRSEIKYCDRVAAFYEATRLAGFATDEAITYFGMPENLPEKLVQSLEKLAPIPANAAQLAFLDRFRTHEECNKTG